MANSKKGTVKVQDLTQAQIDLMREREGEMNKRNDELKQRAEAGTDSGGAKNDLIIVSGNGLKGVTWAGDTVDTIALAWVNANPGTMNFKQVKTWILTNNKHGIANAEDCLRNPSLQPEIYKGQELKLPEGNEITNLNWKYVCPLPALPIKEKEADQPPQIVDMQQVKEEPAKKLAQFLPPEEGAPKLGYAIQRRNYFFGTPPVDAAAKGKENPAKLKEGALLPDEMEGQALKLKKRDDVSKALGLATGGDFYFGRARKQELLFAPEKTYLRGNGALIPNDRYNQKLEENLGLAVDGEGRTIETVMGGALISINRRHNPYHKGIFTDFDTARNVIGKWTATAEAVDEITKFEAIQVQYPKVAERFAKTGTVQDAEALLQMNVQTALSPIVWSVSSRGVPIGSASVLSKATDDVFASPAFLALPDAEKQRLTDTYKPLQALAADPIALKEAIGGEAGYAAMYNPFSEMVAPRSELRFIQKGYGADDDKARPKGMKKDEWRADQAAVEGAVYAKEYHTPRIPTATEVEIGSGILFKRESQSADATRAATGTALRQIQSNPALLDDVITHFATTPGATQKLTDPVFHASRADKGFFGSVFGADSKGAPLLGFKGDKEADAFADKMGVALGGPRYHGTMDKKGGNVFQAAANIVTFGAATPGADRNQNRGLFVKENDQYHVFEKDFQQRWTNGTPAEKEAIRSFMRDEYLPRVIDAHDKGVYFASASVMTGLSPRLAENGNKGVKSDTYQRIEGALGGTVLKDAMIARANATEHLAAEVEQGTEIRVARGEKIVTASEQDVKAALAGEKVNVTGANGGALTVLNTEVIRKAVGSAQINNALFTSNNPDRVGQGITNRENVLLTATASPLAFSMVTLKTLANGSLNAGTHSNLSSYLEVVYQGNKDASRYADLMAKHANAMIKAGPEGAAAAENAAAAELSAYFSTPSGEKPKNHPEGRKTAAVARLAGLMAKDGPVSAAYTEQLIALNADSANVASAGNLSKEQLAQLQAKVQLAKTPEEAGQLVNAYLASLNGGNSVNAGKNAASQVLSGPALNDAQVSQIVGLSSYAPGSTADVKAAVASILGNSVPNAANIAAITSGLNAAKAAPETQSAITAGMSAVIADRQAALDSVNAGNLNAGNLNTGNLNAAPLSKDQIAQISALAGKGLNADELRSTIASITAGPNGASPLNTQNLNALTNQILAGGTPAQTRDFLAGIDADVAGINATWGVSWRAIATTIAAVTVPLVIKPPGTPLIPGIPGGCPETPRPNSIVGAVCAVGGIGS